MRILTNRLISDSEGAIGPPLDGYEQFAFSSRGITRSVYYAGDQRDPPLVVMHELPGLSPGLLMFAERLRAARFCVYLPWLFGPVGGRAPVRNLVRLCISREFAYLRAGVSAPLTLWLRALASQISATHRGSKVGAIGMCVTGAFVIPLILEKSVIAAVAAQPSVPCSPLFAGAGMGGGNWMTALNVSDADIAQARIRLQSGDAHMLAVRCRADRICPKEKLDRLRAEFPVGLQTQEYGDIESRNSLDDRPHATYTKEYRLAAQADSSHPAKQAHEDLLAFLNANLALRAVDR